MPEPERLGRYTLGDKLGVGGMGVVYRARAEGAEGFSKVVAIKTMHTSYASDPGIRDMFVAEATTAQRLQHGNVVQIIDVGNDGGTPYLVIELIDGASLAALLKARGGALPIADALYIAESVAAALAYAHGLVDKNNRPDGVVHRDVTPRNILVSNDGVVKLADFGIAKALSAPSYTLPGTFKGSLGYLAPEQARAQPIDARADQFSFGIVLYEMLSGSNPLAARDYESYVATLDRGIPKLESVDAELAAIVERATAITPADRFASMDELRGELEAWRVARKIRTSPESLREFLRVLLAQDATVPGRALGDLISLPTAETQQQSPRPPHQKWPLVVLGTAALAGAVIAGVVMLRAPKKRAHVAPIDATVVVDAAPDAAMIDAAVVVIDAAVVDAPVAATPKKKGFVKIMVVPYANVSIDGKAYGGVPVNVELAEGPHTVVLSSDVGRVEKRIRVKPGETVEISAW